MNPFWCFTRHNEKDSSEKHVVFVPPLLLGGLASLLSVKSNIEVKWFPQTTHIPAPWSLGVTVEQLGGRSLKSYPKV